MYLIGVTGASGSGKTTLAQRLQDYFGEKATLISLDSYYKDFPELTFEKRAALNFDAPDIHDHALLEQDLRLLMAGKPAPRRVYDFPTHRRKPDNGLIQPHPIVIVEGIHVFARQEVRELCDLKVFTELDPDVCILRRVRRDMEERGRSLDSITLQYLRTVKPMYERYIRNYKECADIVVPTLVHSGIGAEMIAYYVEHHMFDKEGGKQL